MLSRLLALMVIGAAGAAGFVASEALDGGGDANSAAAERTDKPAAAVRLQLPGLPTRVRAVPLVTDSPTPTPAASEPVASTPSASTPTQAAPPSSPRASPGPSTTSPPPVTIVEEGG